MTKKQIMEYMAGLPDDEFEDTTAVIEGDKEIPAQPISGDVQTEEEPPESDGADNPSQTPANQQDMPPDIDNEPSEPTGDITVIVPESGIEQTTAMQIAQMNTTIGEMQTAISNIETEVARILENLRRIDMTDDINNNVSDDLTEDLNTLVQGIV